MVIENLQWGRYTDVIDFRNREHSPCTAHWVETQVFEADRCSSSELDSLSSSWSLEKMTKSRTMFGCDSHSGKPGCEGVAFFRLLMQDNKLLRIWLKRLRRESLQVNKNTRICSLHLEGRRKSGPKGIPSIFPWTNSHSRRLLPKSSTSTVKYDGDDSSHHENYDPDDYKRSSDSSMSASTKSGSVLPSSEYSGLLRDPVAKHTGSVIAAAGMKVHLFD